MRGGDEGRASYGASRMRGMRRRRRRRGCLGDKEHHRVIKRGRGGARSGNEQGLVLLESTCYPSDYS